MEERKGREHFTTSIFKSNLFGYYYNEVYISIISVGVCLVDDVFLNVYEKEQKKKFVKSLRTKCFNKIIKNFKNFKNSRKRICGLRILKILKNLTILTILKIIYGLSFFLLEK